MRAKISAEKTGNPRKSSAENLEIARENLHKRSDILRENHGLRAHENAFEQKRRALEFVENGYKTRVPRETTAKIPRAALKIRRKISRKLFAKKALETAGWLGWFAVAYFGAQFALVALLDPFIWAGILTRDEILRPNDLANALLEAAIYVLMLAIFIGIPTWFSRFRARGGGEEFVAKCKNIAQNFGFAGELRGENAENSAKKPRDESIQKSQNSTQNSAENPPKSRAENARKTQNSAALSPQNPQGLQVSARTSDDLPTFSSENFRAREQAPRKNPSDAAHKSRPKIAFCQRIALDRAPRREDFWWILIGIPDYFLAATIALLSLRLFFPALANQPQNIGFHDGASLAVIFVAVVIVPAVAEEILMRGWLFGKLRARWSFAATAILVSLAFAVAHGQLNVGVDTFILSLVLCNIREKTGSIYGTIALHMLKNFVAFGFLYWWR